MSNSQQNNKSIFPKSKSYLEKSFLEELNYKIWSTKGARFEADKRLTIISKMSNISLSILSAYLIIAGLISVYNIYSGINESLINYIVTALSIILLVLSQYENSQNYSLRAKNFHNCGLELSSLYNKLRLFKTSKPNPSDYEWYEFTQSLSEEYQSVLLKYENHLSIDYDNFKTKHPEYFENNNKKKKIILWLNNIKERYFYYYLIILLPLWAPLLIKAYLLFIRAIF